MTITLLGASELRSVLGNLSRQRISQLTASPDFPAPIARLSMGPVWDHEDIAAWAAARGRNIYPVADIFAATRPGTAAVD